MDFETLCHHDWSTCLTAFNNETYTAGLYLSYLRRYTTHYSCYTLKLKLHWFDFLWICCEFVKRVNNKSNQWSLSLTVHVYAKSRLLSVYVAKCSQYDRCCSLVNTLDVQLCHCMQRDMVDWAWGSVARSIGVSRCYLSWKLRSRLQTEQLS